MRYDLYFRVLGPLAVEHAGQPVSLRGPQRRAVLATLLIHADQVVSLDKLVDVLWEERPPASYRVQLQGLISDLRRLLAGPGGTPAPIDTMPPGYRLAVSADALDLAQFLAGVAEATRLREAGEYGAAAERSRAALALWRGAAFADVPHSAIRRAAERLDDLRLAAIEDRIEAELAGGEADGLIPELMQLVADHPARERLRGPLMTLFARTGRATDALATYQDFRQRTADELGIEPSKTLQELYRTILRGDLEGRMDTAPRVHPRPVPQLLPAAVPELVGRDEALHAATAMLTSGAEPTAPRWVALTGPGGIGKTAFAIQLAQRLRDDFPDGQIYLTLGGVRGDRLDPNAALGRLLRMMGVPAGAVPADADERSALFRNLLAGRRVLLVFDDAVDEAQVRPLLPGEPACAVVVTSRRRMPGIEVLRPLPLDVLQDEDGVALLAALAGAERVMACQSAARDLVRHCGGLPLAIRVAGARLANRPNWTVADLANRLARARERLDWLEVGDIGIRASLADGYAGLGPEQRRLFRRLGLVDLAEFPSWVAGSLLDDTTGSAERLLEALVDVHLVEPAGRGVTGPRYRMHDLVRLVAHERAVAEEQAVERRAVLGRILGGWYSLSIVGDARLSRWIPLDPAPAPDWHPPQEVRQAVREDPLAWFDEERQPLGSAVRQAADAGHAEVAWPLAQRMATYLERRWRVDEWRDATEHGLGAARRAADRRGEATMLRLLVEAEGHLDRFDDSLRHAEEALEIYRELGDRRREADLLARIAAFHRIGGKVPQALAEHEQALTLARRTGDPLTIGFAAYTLGIARRFAGEHDACPALFEEAREAFHRGGARSGEAQALMFIGLGHLRLDRLAEAETCLLRARDNLRDLEHGIGVPYIEIEIARVHARQGRLGEAEALAAAVLATMRLHRQRMGTAKALLVLGDVATVRGDHRAALDAYLEALALWRGLGQQIRVAQTLFALAGVCADLGDVEAAAAYRDEARPLTDKLGIAEEELAVS